MTKVNLQIADGGRLAQVFQAIDVQFAHLNKIDDNNYKQIHKAGKCRDFLGDVVYSAKAGVPVGIWGFKFNNKDFPRDEDALRLSLKFPDKECMEIFQENIDYIKQKEHSAGTESIKIIECNQDLTLIIEADKAWQSCVWKISLYTFFLKEACYKNMTGLQDPENKYRAILTKAIELKLLKKVVTEDKEVYPCTAMGAIHDNSGFVSIIKNVNQPMNQLLLG